VFSVIAFTLVMALGTAGIFALQLNNSFNKAEKLDNSAVFPEDSTRPEATESGAQNILLLGSDSRAESDDTDLNDIRGERSDTIMVAHIASDRKSVQVMSIMRDNWVEIPGHGMNKINAAMALGGVPLTVQTIEGILGVRIDHVAMIDFEGFAGLTDALGGVIVNNPIEFTGRGTHFAKGSIKLSGEDALKFVRERYSFRDGDYQRVRNQQIFVNSVIKKILSRDTLTSPSTINETVAAFAPFLKVDEGLSTSYLASLGMSMSSVRSDDISFFTSPTLGTGMEGKQSVVKPDWEGLSEIANHFQEDTLSEYTPTGK